jgi:hypothetical protein
VGPVLVHGPLTPLGEAQLEPIVQEAEALWLASGLSPVQVQELKQAQVTIEPLGGQPYIGLTQGNQVTIDPTAAGWGWYVDATPADNSEFGKRTAITELQASAASAAYGRMDLLTVVMHELGHVIGLDDLTAASSAHDLMARDLPTGTRRLPAGVSQAALDRSTRGVGSIQLNVGFIDPVPTLSASTPGNGAAGQAAELLFASQTVPATGLASWPTALAADAGKQLRVDSGSNLFLNGPANNFLAGGFASARKPGELLGPIAGNFSGWFSGHGGIPGTRLDEDLSDALAANAETIAAAQDAVFIRDW